MTVKTQTPFSKINLVVTDPYSFMEANRITKAYLEHHWEWTGPQTLVRLSSWIVTSAKYLLRMLPCRTYCMHGGPLMAMETIIRATRDMVNSSGMRCLVRAALAKPLT